MITAIRIKDCEDVTFTNVSIANFDTAFDISDSTDIKMENVHCRATRKAVVGERVKGLQVTNVTHHQSGSFLLPTPLTMIIRRAARGYV